MPTRAALRVIQSNNEHTQAGNVSLPSKEAAVMGAYQVLADAMGASLEVTLDGQVVLYTGHFKSDVEGVEDLKTPQGFEAKPGCGDDSWTGMVEVETRIDEDELDNEDGDMLRAAPYGPYTVSARNERDAEEAILDAFANDVPVSLPEDFDIEVARLKKKAAEFTAGRIIYAREPTPEDLTSEDYSAAQQLQWKLDAAV
jgi:hypothetical protein